MNGNRCGPVILYVAALLVTGNATADEIRIAVASNFTGTLRAIASQFEKRSGHNIIIAPGSTGKHYAQIVNGAPFHAFFAADSERPERLEKEGIAVAGSRFTYALGRLLLWSPDTNRVDAAGNVLERGEFRHLAIANPRLAPHGKAAWQVLEARGVWRSLSERVVRAENISQAYQFVQSGAAELGVVAYAQIIRQAGSPRGSYWEPPGTMHDAIEQQAVLLVDIPPARDFLTFTRSGAIRSLILSHGYGVPPHDDPKPFIADPES